MSHEGAAARTVGRGILHINLLRCTRHLPKLVEERGYEDSLSITTTALTVFKLHTRSKLTLHRPDQCVLLAADRYFDHTLGRQIGDADCGLHISHGDVIEAEAAGLNEPPGFAG